MTLQPCPNEECRGECTLELYTAGHDGTPGLYRAECSSATCAYCGPVSYDPEQAIALHNRMPRTEPWVSVSERMPETNDGYYDVAPKAGDVFPRVAWDHQYQFFHNGGPTAWTADDLTHWRRFVPPRGPVSG